MGWYTAAYLLTTSTCQIAYGKFYKTMSTKLVFFIALSIFGMVSLLGLFIGGAFADDDGATLRWCFIINIHTPRRYQGRRRLLLLADPTRPRIQVLVLQAQDRVCQTASRRRSQETAAYDPQRPGW